jgi:hypothetical protein
MRLVNCLGVECRPRVQNYARSCESSGRRRNSALEASATIKREIMKVIIPIVIMV